MPLCRQRDGSATLIVVELLDQTRADKVYNDLLELIEQAPVANETIHVAGEGAVSGYLGSYIDTDAQRLNPIAGGIITLMLFVAYRTVRGMVLPNLVVLATVVAALGVMAATGVSFFVITNALPVILIGIAVADSIHIMGQYYEELAERPQASQREIVTRAMTQMWRPVTLTTLTTMAGFIGIYIASVMPPMSYFGLFASFGVGVALLYSLLVVPAGLALVKPKPSRAFRARSEDSASDVELDGYAKAMAAFGRWVTRHTGVVLVLAATIAIVGIIGATQLQVQEARINNFKQSEPLYIADQEINRLFDGTNYLDIVIETPQAEDLFQPAHLQRIEALQRYLETLPHVKGTTSVVDYLKQMNRALHEDRKDAYRLPESAELTAQYFLLYSASGDPADFEEEIDYDYRLANVRAFLDTGLYTIEREVVLAAQDYIQNQFNAPGISANLSGRVNVDYHWLRRLSESHFRSVGVALFLVWLMASLSFRSAFAGLLAVVPVSVSILLLYAVMGFAGIWLGIGTSMFAAIAIGLGVDFAIHTIERLVSLIKEQGKTVDQALTLLFPSTGRALFFNFAALALGFGALTTSQVPVLIRFGLLVAVGVSVSFLASMTLLPALVKVVRPAFLGLKRAPKQAPAGSVSAPPIPLLASVSTQFVTKN